ncbi:MAG: radical SAM protein, partial [Planctomycetes bacterium]|nr:radical SAM protein [Planctomycetota bacterium]
MVEPDENSIRDVLPVRVVAWELTRACNLACFYCRASAGNFDPMETSAADAMSTLDEIARLGRPLLILTGGEPLLREDLFRVTEKAVGMGFPVAVASNGTLISAEAASRLSDCGVHRVSVSLDFPEARAHDRVRGEGSFEAAMAGIANLVRAGVALQVNMTVT